MRFIIFLLIFLIGEVHSTQVVNIDELQKNATTENHRIYDYKIDTLLRQNTLLEAKYEDLRLRYEELLFKTRDAIEAHRTAENSIENLNTLRAKYDNLNSELEALEVKLVDANENGAHNDWVGIMLGAATLVITGLSISIAILAIWGYRNIKSGATAEAVIKSKKVVVEKIQGGEFDRIIHKAVEKIIYRDVLSNEDFSENGGSENESL